jgi:hypothetical protein
MKRPLVILALMMLAAFPVAAGDIFGFLEPPVVPAATPAGSPPLHGVIQVSGWALSDAVDGIRRVTIQVDGVDIGEALYHRPRTIVSDLFPGLPNSDGPGFSYFLNATDFPNGVHEITAKVLDFDGDEVILDAVNTSGNVDGTGIQELFWTFNTNTLPPFGKINQPQRNTDLFGNCCRRDDTGACCELSASGFCLSNLYTGITARPYSVVSGWALDLGKEIGDTGVGWVELLVDGSLVSNTRRGCFFSMATGGLTNCYGLQRLDIENLFPFAIDAPTAGFRFVIDVGALIRDRDFVQGAHVLTIRAGDIGNQTANIHEIPVNFFCLNNEDNLPSFGRIESPRRDRPYADLMDFQGWAVDLDGIDSIEVFVDGLSIGFAAFPVGSRPGVLATFPGYPNAAEPVWRLSDFDTTDLSEGVHQVQVEVTDDRGDATLIGEVSFRVNNVVD